MSYSIRQAGQRLIEIGRLYECCSPVWPWVRPGAICLKGLWGTATSLQLRQGLLLFRAFSCEAARQKAPCFMSDSDMLSRLEVTAARFVPSLNYNS